MKINLNAIVRVKLKPLGFAILKAKWDRIQAKYPDVKDYTSPKLDDDGYYRTELWSLMQDFGEHIGMGCDSPMEMDIIAPATGDKTALRDQFAGQAAQGIIARERNDISLPHFHPEIARLAYDIAAAMLAEREKRA